MSKCDTPEKRDHPPPAQMPAQLPAERSEKLLPLAGQDVASTSVEAIEATSIDTSGELANDLVLAGAPIMDTMIVCDPRPSVRTMLKMAIVGIVGGFVGTMVAKFADRVLENHPTYVWLIERAQALF